MRVRISSFPSFLRPQYLESKSRGPLGELDVLGVVRAVSTSKVDATELRRLKQWYARPTRMKNTSQPLMERMEVPTSQESEGHLAALESCSNEKISCVDEKVRLADCATRTLKVDLLGIHTPGCTPVSWCYRHHYHQEVNTMNLTLAKRANAIIGGPCQYNGNNQDCWQRCERYGVESFRSVELPPSSIFDLRCTVASSSILLCS